MLFAAVLIVLPDAPPKDAAAPPAALEPPTVEPPDGAPPFAWALVGALPLAAIPPVPPDTLLLDVATPPVAIPALEAVAPPRGAITTLPVESVAPPKAVAPPRAFPPDDSADAGPSEPPQPTTQLTQRQASSNRGLCLSRSLRTDRSSVSIDWVILIGGGISRAEGGTRIAPARRAPGKQ
jgi:hypothetical protein